MISNSANLTHIGYPQLDEHLPFADYIAACQSMIATRHRHHMPGASHFKAILAANSPYELRPSHPPAGNKFPIGVLLIHGLFDCPFSLRDIGNDLQRAGIFCRSILLPGHGTCPSDLLHVNYQDWLSSLRYGIHSLRNEVDNIILLGYSTGGALAVYHALASNDVDGIISLAPAIKIKAPVKCVVGWHRFLSRIGNQRPWVFQVEEMNEVKYCSVAFNAFQQVTALSQAIHHLNRQQKLTCRQLMITSLEDEIISSAAAIDFFQAQAGAENKALLYCAREKKYDDKRILVRYSAHHELAINHISHMGLPFSPDNPYYGQHGHFIYASRMHLNENQYGAYNLLEVNTSELLYTLGLQTKKYRTLTYNPDFAYMLKTIQQFIHLSSSIATPA